VEDWRLKNVGLLMRGVPTDYPPHGGCQGHDPEGGTIQLKPSACKAGMEFFSFRLPGKQACGSLKKKTSNAMR